MPSRRRSSGTPSSLPLTKLEKTSSAGARRRRRVEVDEARSLAADHGLVAATTIEAGSAAIRIIEHAEETDADVICVGRRGLGSVAGILLGSVSHSISHGAEQTVITVW